jgi:hypothetical protein
MQPLTSVDLIHDHFELEGIERLCFRLKVRYESLPGETRFRKALGLFEELATNGRLLPLFLELKNQRPNLRDDLPFCLHEFVAEQFNTKEKMLALFEALNLPVRGFRGLESFPWGEAHWRADKAEKLQIHMAETRQWDRLLQVLAEQTDEYITLEQLQEVFGLGTPTAVSPSSPPPQTPTTERPFPFDPFLQLNFVSQHLAYRQHLDEPIAAFAVLGLPQTYLKPSLHLLLKRLLAWTTTETAVSRIAPSVDFLPNDADTIWRQVASTVGLGQAGFGFSLSDEDRRKIAQGVYNRLKTQHVIFIFEGLNEAQIELLVSHFWQKLVAEVKALPQNSASDRKLLAFFVDNWGRLSEDACKNLPAPSPVILPPIPPVSHDDLVTWLLTVPVAGKCDPRLRDFAKKPQVEDLVIAQSNGIPDKVLEYICAQCGYDFYGEFSNWLQS